MGVYHLAGLGRSIGAVTAAFSYLAARKALPGAAEDPLFALSGEADEDPAGRGAVEALVLFATREIVEDRLNSLGYELNQAGQARGPTRTGGASKWQSATCRSPTRSFASASSTPCRASSRLTGISYSRSGICRCR